MKILEFCYTSELNYFYPQYFPPKYSISTVAMVMHILSICAVFLMYSISYTKSSFHGGTFLALAGKNSVVLMTDSRFSSESGGEMLLGSHPRMVFRVGSRSLVGCNGLDAHSRHLMNHVKQMLYEHNDHDIGPESVARVVSDIQYNTHLSISPLVVGLQDDGLPFVCTMDSLGAQTHSSNFAVSGTAAPSLLAMCEALYTPDLEAPDLIQLAERLFSMSMQRDVMSGSNFRILTLTKDGIYSKTLNKMDV